MLALATLACSLTLSGDGGDSGGGALSVEISSPAEGSQVPIGQPFTIVASAVAEAGVGKVELWRAGGPVSEVSPEEEGPQVFIANLSYTPDTEGGLVLAVVAYDVGGQASLPDTLSLNVVAGGGEPAPTDTVVGPTPENPTNPPPPTNTNAPPPPPSDTPVPPTATFTPTNTPTQSFIIIVSLLPLFPYTDLEFNTASIPANSNGNATANCPDGSIVTGGGYAGNSDGSLIAYTSSMNGNGWRVYGQNNKGSSQGITVHAACLYNTAGSTSQVFSQATISGNDTGYAQVNCPGSSKVTGGGWASNTDLHVYTSSANGNGWRVYAKNNSGSGKLLNAYAICLSGVSVTTTQQLHQTTVSANSNGNAAGQCPSGMVTGGGFASSSDGTLRVFNTTYFDPNGWRTYARNNNASGQLLNSYAICLMLN
jgi:hypothetical protein